MNSMYPSHVVGIGASAGGLEALQGFFGKVDVKTQFAFVVIQHLDKFKDKLFKPFERLTKQANGKGIGMHLVKTMVEKNGGYLEVESQPEQSTTFKAYLRTYDQA